MASFVCDYFCCLGFVCVDVFVQDARFACCSTVGDLQDAHDVSYRTAEPTGRSFHSLQDARFACYRAFTM